MMHALQLTLAAPAALTASRIFPPGKLSTVVPEFTAFADHGPDRGLINETAVLDQYARRQEHAPHAAVGAVP